MTAESLKEAIKRELPALLRDDPGLREYVLELTRQHHPSRAENTDWFHEMLGELRRDREAQTRKWEVQEQRWKERNAETERERAEQARRWEEHKAETELERAEQARKWEENNRHFDRVHEEIMAQAKKFDRGIGALGARWGIQSERAFRNALAGILEEHFGVQVLNAHGSPILKAASSDCVPSP